MPMPAVAAAPFPPILGYFFAEAVLAAAAAAAVPLMLAVAAIVVIVASVGLAAVVVYVALQLLVVPESDLSGRSSGPCVAARAPIGYT